MHLKLDEVLTSAEAIFHQLSASQVIFTESEREREREKREREREERDRGGERREKARKRNVFIPMLFQDKLPAHICDYLKLGDQTPTEEEKK